MSQQRDRTLPLVLLSTLIVVIVVPFLPLLIAGRWDWWEAWAFAVISILGFAVSRLLTARQHPDLLAERAHSMRHEDAEPWDRVLAPLVGVGSGLIPLVAGLDALRGGPPRFGGIAKALALIVIVVGYAVASYALIANRFFSGTVRIQTDRDHHVVSRGPYRWVRHPGYAGALLTFVATPVLLDSLWAFVPATVIIGALVIRTRLEDRMLQERLPGYREYAGRVRYRLVPRVW